MEISCDAIKNVCGIYKITNKINGKIYVGQSTDIYRRWYEHKRSGQPEKYAIKSLRDSRTPIHLAMQKYGVQNFEISLLESCAREELNEKEKKWIAILNATDHNIGYNVTDGGQNNFALKGERHSQAKLTQRDVDEIINLLQTTNMRCPAIAQQYVVSRTLISQINTGRIWHNPNLTYPIAKLPVGSKGQNNSRAKFTDEQVLEMRHLFSQGETIYEIYKTYNHIATNQAIRAILNNKTYKHLPMWNDYTQTWIEPCIDYSQS